MIRFLAKKLSTFTEFASFVIIEVIFRRGKFESSAEILKSHASMVLLRVSSSEAELLVKLIRPRREIRAALGSRIESSEKIWRVFTEMEILEFVEAVGDKNSIHPPIVPGLLILEKICAEFTANFIKLKFKNFITVDEPLTLLGNGNNFEIYGTGKQKVLIIVE